MKLYKNYKELYPYSTKDEIVDKIIELKNININGYKRPTLYKECLKRCVSNGIDVDLIIDCDFRLSDMIIYEINKSEVDDKEKTRRIKLYKKYIKNNYSIGLISGIRSLISDKHINNKELINKINLLIIES